MASPRDRKRRGKSSGRTGPRRPRPKSPPLLVCRALRENDVATKEFNMVEAFAAGWADTSHFDYLADMRDALMLASADKRDAPLLAVCRVVGEVLAAFRDRYVATGEFSPTPEELSSLRQFVLAYRDFWMRQTDGYYTSVCDALGRAREMNAREVNVQ